MDVILIKDMPGLGDRNDIVKVKPGYARNYLIPKKFAVIATPSMRKIVAENIKQQVNKEKKIRENNQNLAKQLAETADLKILVKSSEKGKLFGSVNNTQISESLNEKGFNIDRRRIILQEPIKQTGSYTAKIKLYKDIEAEINFQVVSDKIEDDNQA